ncbi:MAG: CinA family protein [Boseongicola sp. SB0664_bin_43]|uniref:CinA family protein n=1 Tax=Boseongicola sp. SB0664_bin_43 TaxID=2604844 RepID=A0A6B0Y022_9RHOB|nr:CinA family protein [Boseongicola sp. SB0664_bin_43]MYK32188.1 CinA family protein [Boseongicola sp. SB0670_bin_30]
MNVSDLLDRARRSGVMIATAESCTGGLMAASITDIPGSSDVFERGFVTYSNMSKVDLLGVDAGTIARHGAVSPQVAKAMAEGAIENSKAHVAVSITGVAGPGGAGRKPEGMVCFGLAAVHADTFAETRRFGPIGRASVRAASVQHALALLDSRIAELLN